MSPSFANPAPRRASLTDFNGNTNRPWLDYLNDLANGNVIVQRVNADGQTIFSPSDGRDGLFLVYFVSQLGSPQPVEWDETGSATGAGAFVNAPSIPETSDATYAVVFAGNSDDGKWYAVITAQQEQDAPEQQIDLALAAGANTIAPPFTATPPRLTMFLKQPSGGNATIILGAGFAAVSLYIDPTANTLSTLQFSYRASTGLWSMTGQPLTGMTTP